MWRIGSGRIWLCVKVGEWIWSWKAEFLIHGSNLLGSLCQSLTHCLPDFCVSEGRQKMLVWLTLSEQAEPGEGSDCRLPMPCPYHFDLFSMYALPDASKNINLLAPQFQGHVTAIQLPNQAAKRKISLSLSHASYPPQWRSKKARPRLGTGTPRW